MSRISVHSYWASKNTKRQTKKKDWPREYGHLVTVTPSLRLMQCAAPESMSLESELPRKQHHVLPHALPLPELRPRDSVSVSYRPRTAVSRTDRRTESLSHTQPRQPYRLVPRAQSMGQHARLGRVWFSPIPGFHVHRQALPPAAHVPHSVSLHAVPGLARPAARRVRGRRDKG